MLRAARATCARADAERGDVLVEDGRIAPSADLIAPPGVAVIDVAGRWITPGIIDPHSHLGVYAVPATSATADGNEMTGPFKPDLRAEDSFWPQDPAIERALAGGVTTIHVLPGSANLVGGQGVTLRLVRALSAREMRVPDAPPTMKLACGENPMRIYGQAKGAEPQTRMAEVAMLRQKLENARAYKLEEGKARDFATDALARVLRGEICAESYRGTRCYIRPVRPVRHAARIHHAVEAAIRDRLAQAGVGAVVWADWGGLKMELVDAVPANAALLDEAGVRVALHSDSPYDIQRLNQEAAKAMAAGRRAGIPVEREAALRWITANPAWILGIDARVGTLGAGQGRGPGGLVGDPFSVYAHAELVFIEGAASRRARTPARRAPTSSSACGVRSEGARDGDRAGRRHRPHRPGPAARERDDRDRRRARARRGHEAAPARRRDGDRRFGDGYHARPRRRWHSFGNARRRARVRERRGNAPRVGRPGSRGAARGRFLEPRLAHRADRARGRNHVRARDARGDRYRGRLRGSISPSGGLRRGLAALRSPDRGPVAPGPPPEFALGRFCACARPPATRCTARTAVRTSNKLRETISAADLEVLDALARELIALASLDRASDILTVAELAEQFGLRVVIVGGAEAWQVAGELARAGIPVVLDPFADLPASFGALQSARPRCSRRRARDPADLDAPLRTACARRGEMPRCRPAYDAAIASITRVPAEVFGVPDAGTIRAGAIANLVVWNGDPLEVTTWPERMWIRGQEVSLQTRQDLLTGATCAEARIAR
jgi:imidazolonepropionase-like amidohydrolase